MPAVTGFKSDRLPSVIVHPTTPPDPANIAPIGTIWIQVLGIKTFVAAAQGAGGTTTVWTQVS